MIQNDLLQKVRVLQISAFHYQLDQLISDITYVSRAQITLINRWTFLLSEPLQCRVATQSASPVSTYSAAMFTLYSGYWSSCKRSHGLCLQFYFREDLRTWKAITLKWTPWNEKLYTFVNGFVLEHIWKLLRQMYLGNLSKKDYWQKILSCRFSEGLSMWTSWVTLLETLNLISSVCESFYRLTEAR